jgi:hypothetical protein
MNKLMCFLVLNVPKCKYVQLFSGWNNYWYSKNMLKNTNLKYLMLENTRL